ncbi:DUF4625 domain-containing protein [Carboxylicivirga marina]|uniref:DUF4625 domain-containing protein n=1 Tax=Carboxylicivirga marina TaxID=2800988 RepID=A0ABS1HL97_9BACT|nr:DUF4625 domain-containing protein [Carboxylicivirga marina]MBK3518438.1 DUF4625 domain-containing protein [Carboxylicivirga marina]
MKIQIYLLVSLALSMVFNACETDKDIDTEKPVIDISFEGAKPINCETLYFGEAFELKMLLTDNVELGSYSVNIHHNFNQHSHSTEVTQCEFDEVKEAVNPFILTEDYTIPDNLRRYTTSDLVTIPSGNNDGLYDEGDYHFFISLTDHEGWSTQKGLSIKILHR